MSSGTDEGTHAGESSREDRESSMGESDDDVDIEYLVQDVDVGSDSESESAATETGASQSEYSDALVGNVSDSEELNPGSTEARALLERLVRDYYANEADDDDGDEEYVDEDDDEEAEEEEEDDDEQDAYITINGNVFRIRPPRRQGTRARYNRRRPPVRPGQENLEPVPSKSGRELMFSGEFGYDEATLKTPKRKRRESSSVGSPPIPHDPGNWPDNPSSPTSSIGSSVGSGGTLGSAVRSKIRRPSGFLSKRLLVREMGAYVGERARIAGSLIAQSMLPSKTDKILFFESRCYSGQFSPDGNLFYTCAQDMKARIYDTSNPYDWKFIKGVYHHEGRWTLTDACISQDNRKMAYSSIHSVVYLTNTDTDDDSDVVRLDFAAGNRHARGHAMPQPSTGIWSIRFSGDGREIVAGASDTNIYVYDLEVGRPILRLAGHEDHVNAVCYGDISSPHILFSGSDDSTIKIWDRRSMASGKEAGAFIGHLEGLTYIDAKGDGRYVLSNGKDQTMKLWDIRKMVEHNQLENMSVPNYSIPAFDYRIMTYDDKPIRIHPHDCSVVTYRGHRVLKTLIRCHFSPPTSSGSRYVYTGSEDGRIYIYNLDATLAGIIDVQKATENTKPRRHVGNSWNGLSAHGLFRGGQSDSWMTLVRDVSWHPSAPMIVSTAWNGYGGEDGTLAVHTWNGKGGSGKKRKTEGGEENGSVEKDSYGNDIVEDQPELFNERLRPLRGR